MRNKNYYEITQDDQKHYNHPLGEIIVRLSHRTVRFVFPLKGHNGQLYDVQSFGCVSHPKHSVQNALMAVDRVNSTSFNLPDLRLTVCLTAIGLHIILG